MSEVSDAEKAVFLRATERRRQNGIKLKQIRMNVEQSQAEGFYELFEPWVQRYGKVGAMDLVIVCMSAGEARIQDAKRAKKDASKAAQKG
jgi:hypothetical protein